MKNFVRISIFILILILISFIVLETFIILEGKKTYEKKVDYLFILGARLYGDTPSPALLERLKVGVEYLKKHSDVKVVLAGGKGRDEKVSEADAMKDYLIKNGIEEERILLEDKSVNTFQNIRFGLEKIREIDDREDLKVLIATNRFHILRSKLIAKRAGLEVYGLPAKVPPTTIVPSYIREYFALIKTFLFDR